jgi:hypothetical protein
MYRGGGAAMYRGEGEAVYRGGDEAMGRGERAAGGCVAGVRLAGCVRRARCGSGGAEAGGGPRGRRQPARRRAW